MQTAPQYQSLFVHLENHIFLIAPIKSSCEHSIKRGKQYVNQNSYYVYMQACLLDSNLATLDGLVDRCAFISVRK